VHLCGSGKEVTGKGFNTYMIRGRVDKKVLANQLVKQDWKDAPFGVCDTPNMFFMQNHF
jgi:hypothetical protein